MRKILISTIAATVIAVAGCGGGDSTGPVATIAGTYDLKTVNSAALPFVALDDASGKFEILADTYNLSEDGTYTNPTQLRITYPGSAPSVEVLTSTGTYTRSGSSITLTSSDDPTDKITGTIASGTMTLTSPGFVLVYQRSGG